METKELLILGSGVSGLSTGILLLKNGYKVTIWAKDLPPNTTSNKAAAFWYPYLCKPPEKATVWAKFTQEYLRKEFINDPKSGCVEQMVIEVFDKNVDDPWWKDAVTDFHRVSKDKLPQGYVDGYEINALLMDTSIYMNYLYNLYISLGGGVVQKTVMNVEEALNGYDTVVNCTGLGSRELFNDKEIYPVRGQMVRIKPNGFDYVIADDEGPNKLAVIIPRLHDIMLGGTTQVNDWNLEEDPKDTQDILRKAAALNPAFKNVEIIEVTVGLRPFRSEVRLEVEKNGSKNIIHNYGHGGAGFTLSWGCANNVLSLIKNL